MPRPSNTGERRQQIVEGLLAVMAEHGYDGSSTQAIADAAGLGAGLVHYHFANKREILLDLVDELASRLDARYRARAARAESAWERLVAFLDAHVALGRDADPRAVACWVHVGAESLRDADVRAAYQRSVRAALAELERLIAEVLAEEHRDTEAATTLAAGLYATIEGAYHLAIAARATPAGFAAETLRRMARGLVDAQPKTRGKRGDR